MDRNRTEPAITADSTIVRSEGQVSTDLGDEILLLGLEAGSYHRLEGVAARVWRLIETGAPTVADVRDAIVREYGVDADRCEADLRDLFGDLRARGLVEVRQAVSET